MGKARSAAKERYWRKLIQRHHDSGEGTTAFCRRVGVSRNQLYAWRRILRSRDAEQQPLPPPRPADSVVMGANGKPEEPVFIPVRLFTTLNAPIEVVHPHGCVVRIPAVFDTQTLQRVLTALDASELTEEEC